MLFDSTLRRDLARTFGATLVVLLTIVITMLLMRTLSLAASDLVEPKDVVLVLGYATLGQLATILSLSLFVAIVATLGRMYRDSEMAIWFASGLELARFVRPVLRTAWPVLLVIALLLAFAWPWVNRNSAELRDRYAQRSDLARVAPGVFQSSSDGRRVFFVEPDPHSDTGVRNVFALSVKGDTESVVSARAGHIEVDGDDRYVVLEAGQRSDVDAASGEATLSGFDSYRALVDVHGLRRVQEAPVKTLSSPELVRNPTPRNRGELVWRVGMALAAVNLALLAIGLAHVDTRRPRSLNLIVALVGSLAYYNSVNLTQSWVASGRLGVLPALLGLHGGVFLAALALLWWRDHGAVLRQRPGARSSAGKAVP
ncbi:MAG TPA: LPS export ABC transporter permease LptF [Rubrivivax sp.]|nr:LPS export ABC transporter permease LptF [Rubrivivax sp.]HPO18481.1 LPS export ABC transporter permease LptF [Rubrivivax sp.]